METGEYLRSPRFTLQSDLIVPSVGVNGMTIYKSEEQGKRLEKKALSISALHTPISTLLKGRN